MLEVDGGGPVAGRVPGSPAPYTPVNVAFLQGHKQTMSQHLSAALLQITRKLAKTQRNDAPLLYLSAISEYARASLDSWD